MCVCVLHVCTLLCICSFSNRCVNLYSEIFTCIDEYTYCSVIGCGLSVKVESYFKRHINKIYQIETKWENASHFINHFILSSSSVFSWSYSSSFFFPSVFTVKWFEAIFLKIQKQKETSILYNLVYVKYVCKLN